MPHASPDANTHPHRRGGVCAVSSTTACTQVSLDRSLGSPDQRKSGFHMATLKYCHRVSDHVRTSVIAIRVDDGAGEDKVKVSAQARTGAEQAVPAVFVPVEELGAPGSSGAPSWPGCTPSLCGQRPDGSAAQPGERLLAVAREILHLGLSFSGGTDEAEGSTVEVRLADGTPAGILRGTPLDRATPADSFQLQGMAIIAGLIGQELDQQRTGEQGRDARRAALRRLFTDAGTTAVMQPICRLDTGDPVGYEALARFHGAGGAELATEAVFAEARDLGLGVELELAAARSALQLLPRVPAPGYLSVNLSPAMLLDPRTADLFGDVEAERVVLELTEHQRVEDYPALSAALTHVRRRGVRLAVDDAGAGFASLQHISRLHPDLIKLDRALIQAVQDDPSRRALVRAMVQFSRETGASLVAEGVEDDAEITQLIELGVEFGQGFRLGRPATPSHWLAEQPRAATIVSGRHQRRAPAA